MNTIKRLLIGTGIFLAGLAAALCSAQSHDLRPYPLYELYSWRDNPSESWSYSILPSPSGVYTSADAIFSKKTRVEGVDAVLRQISKMPAGARILWLDRVLPENPENAKKSQRLGYPPPAAISRIENYAKSRNIQLEIHWRLH